MFGQPSVSTRVVGAVGVLGTVLGVAAAVHGMFIRPDLVNIPVPRLINNLEQLVQQKPKDASLRFNLARAHAMAFALKTDTATVWKGKEDRGVWFGFTPSAVPFKVQKTDDPAKKQAAAMHLDQALKLYQEVIELTPDNLAARLGHAWLEDQAGKKMEAIREYRDVIERAWAQEGKRTSGPLGGNFITAEAAGYLIPLLNKEKDRDEIAKLQTRIAHLQKLPRPVTPLVIPLRDGLGPQDLLNPAARVRFDADGSGLQRQWTWITRDAAWLVYDPQGRGQVTSALQLFGNVTFWLFWEDGYQALSVLDDNHDGFLSGHELDGLALWRDANGNGVCEPGEVQPLAAWGIVKLSCRAVRGGPGPDCTAHAPAGVWFRDGTVRPTFDLLLRPR